MICWMMMMMMVMLQLQWSFFVTNLGLRETN